MWQAVKKDGVDGCDFELSRMSHASMVIERSKLEFMYGGENIFINSSESWVSATGLYSWDLENGQSEYIFGQKTLQSVCEVQPSSTQAQTNFQLPLSGTKNKGQRK